MKKYRYMEVLYVPNVLDDRAVVVGIILWRPGSGFVQARKRTDWSAVLALDPDADTEFLAAAVDHIEVQFRQADEVERERLITRLSMNLTTSEIREVETGDPDETLQQLAIADEL